MGEKTNEVVAIDAECVKRTAGNRNETETVTFALFDVDDGERNLRTAVKAAYTVYQTCVGNRHRSGLEEVLLRIWSHVMVPVREGDDSAV
jgi:hypothetical protein